MTADVPLLSSYKRALVARLVFSLFSKPSTSLVRRLVFTVTGFRLVPGHAPFYSLLLRLLLWLLPLLLVLLPAILPPPLGPSLAAALILGFTIALRLTSCVIGQKPSVGGGEGEEEELVWDGVLGPTTWTVLLPPRHLLAGLALQVHFLIQHNQRQCFPFQPLLACLVAASSCLTLHPPALATILGSSWPLVAITNWFTVAAALQAVIVQPPPEPATFR